MENIELLENEALDKIEILDQSSYKFYKRLLDCLLIFIFSPFILLVMILISIFIKIDSKGPILFTQKRVGKGGGLFNCYKFRTMVKNAEEIKKNFDHLNEMSGPAFKITNDPRTTRLGKFLRKSSLDEFPQFFNILKGEMSIVGPRPALPNEVNQYISWQRKRLSVLPGLTCLWQINGRNSIVSFDEWMKMDIEYIETASLKNDLKIILKTFPAVLSGKGAC